MRHYTRATFLVGTFGFFAISSYFVFNSLNNKKNPAFSNDEIKPKDFQSRSGGKDYIFKHFKENDGKTMVKMISEIKGFKDYQSPNSPPLSITDLGGGSGEMLDYLLLLANQISININEPMDDRRKEYIGKAEKSKPKQVVEIKEIPGKMEDITQLPTSDIVLASHSLYYNTKNWRIKEGEQIEFKFLDKIMNSLRPGGAFCVILQSNSPTGLRNKKGGEIPNLEKIEDFVHPLVSLQRDGTSVDNRSRPYFANAEMFLDTLNEYKKQFDKTQHLFWCSSPPIVCQIPLGILNFNKNPVTKKYDQSQKVTQILNFYSAGLFCPENPEDKRFTAEQQRQFLNYIAENCQVDGNYSIVHVNKIIVIIPTPLHQTIQHREELKSTSNLSL